MTWRSFTISTACLISGLLGLLTHSSVLAQRYDAYSLADSVTIGQRFEIAISVEHDGSRSPLFPHDFLPDSLRNRPAFELGGFTILGNSPPGRREISNNWFIDSLRYEVATFELDSAYVTSFPVGLISSTDTLIAGTPGVLVWITSLVQDDAEGIRDITGLADFPGISVFWYFVPFLLLGLAYWLWRRSRKTEEIQLPEEKPEPKEPPWDEARRRLKLLEKMDLSKPENVKPFYVELSELLRTYLSRRADIPALETTTREVVSRLRSALNDGIIPQEIVGEMENVLSNADLVKFADMRPADEAGRAALSKTSSAIIGTEKEFTARQDALREEADRAEAGNRDADQADDQEDEAIDTEDDAAEPRRVQEQNFGAPRDGNHE